MSTFKNLYNLVKAFWVDFFREAKRGTQTHQKGIKVFLLSCMIVFFLILVSLLKFSETSTFCGLCHQMTAYIESWKASSHRNVACTQCHYEPGFFNHLKGKWVDGQVSLAYFISGKKPSKPHAEISDSSCLQKGCHKVEDLQGNMVYKNVAFSHGAHLGELRRGMKLRCTTCHAQIVQGAHLTVHEINCFICHYYRAGARGEEDCISCAIGSCTSCHVEPKGDIKVKGWSFNHQKYIARNVNCEKCHLNVVQGDGHIPDGKCLECHNEPQLLNTKYASPFLHKKHVTDHKIECSSCHTPIRHEIGQIPTLTHFQANCDKCHTKEVHLGPRDLYRGSGGIGVPDSPSLMFTTNVDCVACHRKGEESKAALYTTKYEERAISEACVDCHGEGFDETLKQWKALMTKAENETNQRIFNVQQMLFDVEKAKGGTPAFKKAQNLLNEARHNYSLVLLGKGTHNVEYAFKLLNAANHRTELALAAMDKNYKPRESHLQMTCTTLCHVGIETRSVPFNDIKFSHETHVAGNGLKCSDCHSPRENHGKTYLKNCARCHHGKEIKKVSCGECHVYVKRLIEGKGSIGVKERPSNKLGVVECVDCHRGVTAKKKDNFDAIKKRCIECHDQSYGEMAVQWKTTYEELMKKIAPKIDRVRGEIEKIDRRGGHTFVFQKLFGEAEFNYNLAKKGNGIHNLEYTEELLEFANRRLDEATQQLAKRKQDISRGRILSSSSSK
jgi:nitrate/TMAO reductase-like tetraheme cytochrome c subunit